MIKSVKLTYSTTSIQFYRIQIKSKWNAIDGRSSKNSAQNSNTGCTVCRYCNSNINIRHNRSERRNNNARQFTRIEPRCWRQWQQWACSHNIDSDTNQRTGFRFCPQYVACWKSGHTGISQHCVFNSTSTEYRLANWYVMLMYAVSITLVFGKCSNSNCHFLFSHHHTPIALTNSPSLARIQFPTVSGGSPVVVIPNTMVTTSNITSDLLSNTIAKSQGIAAISTTLPVTTKSDYIIRSTSPSNVIITEVTDDQRHHSADELEFDDNLRPTQMNRRNSMSVMSAKQGLARQLSDSSKSNDSPSLPKRNQPITSSAPSTLNKTKPEEKAGEVFV